MNARRATGAALGAITLAAGATCGWAGAPLWLSLPMLGAGVIVALRPFGRRPSADQIDALQRRLHDARMAGASSAAVPAVVTPGCIAFPLTGGTRQLRTLLLRDEVPAAQWHQLAAQLRMQPAEVETGANVLARFIDSSLAKPKQL